MTKLEQLWQNKDVRVFVWNTLSLFIWTTITLVTDDVIHLEEPWLSIFFLIIVPTVMQAMKIINKKYFNDIWVSDATKVLELETKIAKLKENLDEED